MAADTDRKQQPFRAPQKISEKGGSTWSTPDRACTHCRERKIRCGREKPKCMNCQRDGVACDYYPPGKRVNHIKLLCDNVGNLQDRLSSVERKLSRLTALLRADSNQRNEVHASFGESSYPQAPLSDCAYFEEKLTTETSSHHHIVCGQKNHTDCYYGPRTLFVLCKEISDMLSESPSCRDLRTKNIESEQGSDRKIIKEMIDRICLDAGMDEQFNFQADYVHVRLPSKQFLMIVISQFFEQSDYTTDIFVRSPFMARLEQIYTRQSSPADEAWAICFNAIILLVLGSDGGAQDNSFLFGSQLAQPFILTIRTALSNSRILMVPELVNVQALALLSLAAQQYCSHGVASSVFAQACVLARIMGLNQSQAVSDTVDSEQSLERFKVIRSLFLRDKSLSLSRNPICWLPTVDCALLFRYDRNSLEDSKYGSRVQLASLQENVYRLLNSECTSKDPMENHGTELARIEKEMHQWAKTNGIFSSTHSDIDLDLEFLATRINAFWGSPEPEHIRRTLNDARNSCLLLLVFYGKLEPSMVGRFELSPLSNYISKSWNEDDTSPGKRNNLGATVGCGLRTTNGSSVRSARFLHLVENFPVPAFFLLIKNILSQELNIDQTQQDDIYLLKRVNECYSESANEIQGHGYIQKIRCIFTRLLRLVYHVKPAVSPEMSDAHVSMNTPDILAKQQDLRGLADISEPSTCSPFSPFQDGHSTKFRPTGTLDATTTDVSPVLLTSMEPEYLALWGDPIRQPLSLHHPKRTRDIIQAERGNV